MADARSVGGSWPSCFKCINLLNQFAASLPLLGFYNQRVKCVSLLYADVAIQTPADPQVQTPADPNIQTPAYPDVQPAVSATPADPDLQTPADPDIQTPAYPDVQPAVSATPADPDLQTPADPDIQTPAYPDVQPAVSATPADPDVQRSVTPRATMQSAADATITLMSDSAGYVSGKLVQFCFIIGPSDRRTNYVSMVSICLSSVCPVHDPVSKTEKRRQTKIGGTVAPGMCNRPTSFEVKRSKVKVGGPNNGPSATAALLLVFYRLCVEVRMQ